MTKAKRKPPEALRDTFKAIEAGQFDPSDRTALGKALALRRGGFVTRERDADGETWKPV